MRVFFLGTGDPRVNAARVADRVIRGGYSVPIGKMGGRYERSLASLSVAVDIADLGWRALAAG